MIPLTQPVFYCAKCDDYYPFSEEIKTCPSCNGILWKVSGIMRSNRLRKMPFQHSTLELIFGGNKTCSFCKFLPVFQCIFEYQGRKYTSFCCYEHAKVCTCWKLGGFSNDSTGELSNPLEILNIIQNAILAKMRIITPTNPEEKKIIEYLDKLEKLHKQGQISDKAYSKLKEEYERKLKKKEDFTGTIVRG
ncbi:MAG: hypothetical protein QXM98_06825 [Thermoproteota archaeon]